MIQCSHRGSVAEMSWVKDSSPVLSPYKQQLPAPHHSSIPGVRQQHPAVACTPFLATGASADLTAALSCHNTWLAVAVDCTSLQESCEQRHRPSPSRADTSSVSWSCRCPAAPCGKGRQGHQAPKGWSHLPQGCTTVDEGDSPAQTPHKCYPFPGAVLDKAHPSAVARHKQE